MKAQKFICIMISAISLFLITCNVYALSYPPGFTLVQVPSPLSGINPVYPLVSLPVPTTGQSFYDQHFGTILTRVSQGHKLRQEYSRFDPFNADQSMIIFYHIDNGEYMVYRTASFPYDADANLVRSLSQLDEPRWDQSDQNIVWGLESGGLSILQMNVLTGQVTVVKNFADDLVIGPIINSQPDPYRITTLQEGEASYDKRFWALCLQGSNDDGRVRYLFCWDRSLNTIVGLRELSISEAELIDWVGMSPLGNWVLIGGDVGSGITAGLTMADRQLTIFHRLAESTAHSDIGLDAQNREVILMQNSYTDYVDLIPISPETTPVTTFDQYTASSIVPLMRLYYASDGNGFQGGIHISCNFNQYCVVSTYTEPGLPEQNWLDRTIVIIRLDRNNPAVFYLAKVHNTTGTYWEETQATISSNGKKVIWVSNWGINVGLEQFFVMQLDTPPFIYQGPPFPPVPTGGRGLPWLILFLDN